ncbi:MAG TPA: hypothetical protein VHU44_09020 [Acidobacteriaceae bacterium]|nr:hypothetical protein [Acidobacteriaceae bacterium]
MLEPALPHIVPGVTLLTKQPTDPQISKYLHENLDYAIRRAERAAVILCGHLNDSNIACDVEPSTLDKEWPKFLADDVILVRVGPKPDYWIARYIAQSVTRYHRTAKPGELKNLDQLNTPETRAMRDRDERVRAERQRIVTEERERQQLQRPVVKPPSE